jgi:hypothetical protein
MKNTTKNTAFSRFIRLAPFLHYREPVVDWLVEACSFTSSVRDFTVLRNITDLLNNPLGQFYAAVADNDYSSIDKFAIENLPDKYRGRAILCMAQCLRYSNELKLALKLCLEAFNLSMRHRDFVTCFQAQKEMAIIYSFNGDNKKALNLLEDMYSLARAIQPSRPALYMAYLNSLAVEMAECGQWREARNAIALPLASPFVDRYPEWRETRAEILMGGQQASRSIVPVVGLPVAEKVVHPDFNQADRSPYTASGNGQAGVVDFEARKTEMAKEQKKSNEAEQPDNQEFRRLSHDEKEHRLVREIVRGDLLDEDLDYLMDQVNRLRDSKHKKEGQ